MVRPVSLSDPAFGALRKEKRSSESDSDVVLRLVEEARHVRKDPWRFVRNAKNRKRAWSAEEHLTLLERARQAEREGAERKWRERHGRR